MSCHTASSSAPLGAKPAVTQITLSRLAGKGPSLPAAGTIPPCGSDALFSSACWQTRIGSAAQQLTKWSSLSAAHRAADAVPGAGRVAAGGVRRPHHAAVAAAPQLRRQTHPVRHDVRLLLPNPVPHAVQRSVPPAPSTPHMSRMQHFDMWAQTEG